MAYYDEQIIRKALSLLKPNNEIFEIRILFSNKKVLSGYFKDVDTAIKQIKTVDLKNANVYFTINSVEDACYDRSQQDVLQMYNKATTSDKDIKSYDYIMIDLDPVRPSDTSSTDEQIQEAKELGNKIYRYLRDVGFEQPAFGFSGNGVHLLYKVALVNCDDNKNMLKRFLETLGLLFDTENVKVDNTTFNPARICKLYGTLAQKGANSKKRPHRMSYIIGNQAELKSTDIEYIRKFNSLYPIELDKPQEYNNYNPRTFDVEDWLNKYNINYHKVSISNGSKLILDCCPFDSNHKGKDAAIFKMSNGAIGFKCFHNSCEGKTWQDVRKLFEPDAYERKQQYDEKRKYQSFNREQKPLIIQKDKGNIWQSAKDIYEEPERDVSYIRTGIHDFDSKVGGLIKGGTSVVSGLRGSAKSTWVSQIVLNAIDDGNRAAVYSGELASKKYLKWMFRQAAGKAYIKQSGTYENSYYVPKEIELKILNWLSDNFYKYNNLYGNNFKQILETCKDIIKTNKIDLLVLDNLMALDISSLSDNKYDAQTEFALQIHQLAEETNVHIMYIAHPRKALGFLRLDDISGAADLSNTVDDAFIVHRNNNDFKRLSKQMFGWKEDAYVYSGTNVIEVAKERENGLQDEFYPLYFEKETKRLKNDFTENRIYGWNTNSEGFTSDPELLKQVPFETDDLPFEV